MAYKATNSRGNEYFLHSKVVELKTGVKQEIYFFAKDEREEGQVDEIPEGYEVSESKNGLPVLKKSAS